MRHGRQELGLEPVRGLKLLDLLLQRGAAARDALDHRIEGAREGADLVRAPHRDPGGEVAACDRVGRVCKGLQRLRDGTGQEQCAEHGGDREQGADQGRGSEALEAERL